MASTESTSATISIADLDMSLYSDYTKLIAQFGTKAITPDLLERFERLTGRKPHRLLRRGTFFSHRSVDNTFDQVEHALMVMCHGKQRSQRHP
jgi:hypothetical protein